MFARGSRYATVATAVYVDASGQALPYKLLRVFPNPPAHQSHVVAQGERLDLIAHRYYRDPEQFWRICDANRALRPDDLTAEVGRRLAIPLAQGYVP